MSPQAVRIRRTIWEYKESRYTLCSTDYDATVRTLQEEVSPIVQLDPSTSSVLCLIAIRIPEASFRISQPETKDEREFHESLNRYLHEMLQDLVFERLEVLQSTIRTDQLSVAELVEIYTLQLAATFGLVIFDNTPGHFRERVLEELCNESGSGILHSTVILVDAAHIFLERVLNRYPKVNHDEEKRGNDYKGKGKAKASIELED